MKSPVRFTYSTPNESVREEAAKGFAALAAIGLSLLALVILAVGSYAENAHARSVYDYSVVIAPSVAAFFAWTAVHFIGADQPRYARIALVCQAPMAIFVLLAALQASTHSDGKLLAFGLAVEICALISFVLSA